MSERESKEQKPEGLKAKSATPLPNGDQKAKRWEANPVSHTKTVIYFQSDK